MHFSIEALEEAITAEEFTAVLYATATAALLHDMILTERRLHAHRHERISKKVDRLRVSDQVNVAGHVELTAVAGAKVKGSLTVERPTPDEYEVSGRLDAKVGVSLVGDAFAGAVVGASFRYHDADGAKRAACY